MHVQGNDFHPYSLLTYITCLAGYSLGTVKTNSRKYLKVESTFVSSKPCHDVIVHVRSSFQHACVRRVIVVLYGCLSVATYLFLCPK